MKLGVCSWSLRPRSAEALVRDVRAAGLRYVQLALDPISTGEWTLDATREALAAHDIGVLSGMFGTVGEDYSSLASIAATGGLRPDEHWPANLARARDTARLAAQLELPLVTFHAGFLPHESADPERARLLDRLREVADVFAAAGVALALETGQERADTLLAVLAELEHPNLGVNFDPANMLLYDMGDPVAALDELAPQVRQVHIKDARRSGQPGEWGTEVPVGEGEVNWPAFFEVFARRGLSCDLVIEREAGEQRVDDVRRAAEQLRELGAAPRA
ncbi:MAG: hexulose-6-phosphate isomerase [Planctomycetota bacterium]|nr:MAG: hexulose-6-phosphate isomerase [Planctomycetota bacterium]